MSWPTMDERLAEARKMIRAYEMGYTVGEIAAAAQVTKATVYNRFEMAGYKPKRQTKRDQLGEALRVRTLRDRGWPLDRIARELKMCHKTVSKRLEATGGDNTRAPMPAPWKKLNQLPMSMKGAGY